MSRTRRDNVANVTVKLTPMLSANVEVWYDHENGYPIVEAVECLFLECPRWRDGERVGVYHTLIEPAGLREAMGDWIGRVYALRCREAAEADYRERGKP